jgi:hypothetical protein
MHSLVQKEQHAVQVEQVDWHGDIGLWKKKRRVGKVGYDFVQRDAEDLARLLRCDGGEPARAVEGVSGGGVKIANHEVLTRYRDAYGSVKSI